MATLYVKTPNGTTKSINLDTMNITGSHAESSGWYRLPNGIMYQWGPATTTGAETIIVTLPISVTSNGVIAGLVSVKNGDNFNGRATITGNVQFASGEQWYASLKIWCPKFDSNFALTSNIAIRWLGLW